jgi:hypothetical protein
MTKAKTEVITRGNYLDRTIVRVAASTVRRLVAEGHAPDTALGLATPGSWSEYRSDVQVFLRAGISGI